MNENQKRDRLRSMSTEALKRIADNPLGPEDATPTPERPLAGLVHLTGIGQVPMKMIRAELTRREG